jgi:hypothetical protein
VVDVQNAFGADIGHGRSKEGSIRLSKTVGMLRASRSPPQRQRES